MLTRICPIIDRCVSRYTTGSREYLINDNDDDADDDGDNDDSEEDSEDSDFECDLECGKLEGGLNSFTLFLQVIK